MLTIPGKMLPDENQLTIPNLDKGVHIILFGCFVFLWSFYFASRKDITKSLNRKLFRIFIIACFFGIAMEYVQKYLIPNRDFDIYDIAADIIGAAVGLVIGRILGAGVGRLHLPQRLGVVKAPQEAPAS